MRRQHLDNTTFCVFPEHVILKRENYIFQAGLVPFEEPVSLQKLQSHFSEDDRHMPKIMCLDGCMQQEAHT